MRQGHGKDVPAFNAAAFVRMAQYKPVNEYLTGRTSKRIVEPPKYCYVFSIFYKLVDHEPVRCASGQVWEEWYEAACQSGERVVARDQIGPFEVSTIFTGLDLNPVDASPPQLFETMVFVDGRSTGVSIRSATWKQAEQAHRVRVRDAEEGNADDDA